MKSMFNFKCTPFSDFTLASSGFGENIFAVVAGNHRLSMTEHNISFVATSTSNIHEV